MSEAPKDSTPAAQSAETQPEQSEDSAFALSAAEAERAAAQFKPAWEVDAPDAAGVPGAADDAPSAGAPEAPAPSASTNIGLAPAVASPAPTAVDAQPAAVDAQPAAVDVPVDLSDDAVEEQGPVDIVAEIPKRTEIEIKDEPSVVVPDDAPAPVIPAAALSVQADVVSLPPDARRSRNKWIVLGVVGLAGLFVIAAGIRFAVSGGDETESATLPTATTATEPPAPTETAAAPTETAPAPTETAPAPTPSETATEAPPATATAPEHTAKPPATKPPKPATTTPPKTTTTPPPASTQPPPPKTSKPPATSKPPSGGIVRDTPF